MTLQDHLQSQYIENISLEKRFIMLASRATRTKLSRMCDNDARPFFKPCYTEEPATFLGMRFSTRPALPDNIIILRPIASNNIEDCLFYNLDEEK